MSTTDSTFHSNPPFVAARELLRRVPSAQTKTRPNRPELWVVAYVNQDSKLPGGMPLLENALADLDASFKGGADAVVLINEWCSFEEIDQTLTGVRQRHPDFPLGINYLGDEKEPYGHEGSFKLAEKHRLQIVWTDFSGVDLIQERPPISLHEIEKYRALAPKAFYCSGVHMKYSTVLDPLKTVERSALQAMGWVDGVIMTGPKTGVPADPTLVHRVRKMIGDYPLGLASGVSPQNAAQVRDLVDFCLVASSLQDENKRIVESKVRALELALRRNA